MAFNNSLKYAFSICSIRGYAIKSSLPVKWIRPEKIPCYKPEKSGDLDSLEKPNESSDVPLEFRDSEELKTADEIVRRLFTLEFFPYKKTVEAIRADYLSKVKRHELDKQSPEARLAKMTADIRDMQATMEQNPRNVLCKVRLKETIDKRKKLLKQLRTYDYKRFEWILDELKLEYKPSPPRGSFMRVERKHSLRLLTQEYCENIKNKRLEEYKLKLEVEKETFLLEKINTLKYIKENEEKYDLTRSVSDADIEEVVKKLEHLRASKKKEEVVEE